MLRTSRPAVSSFAVAVLAVASAWADGGDDGDFMSTVGTRSRHEGKLTLKVYEQAGKLNYRVCRDGIGGGAEQGPSKASIEKGSPWFIFSESADEVWIFDGRESLILRPFHDRRPGYSNGGFYEVPKERSTLDTMPKALRDHLPETFKASFRAR